MRHAVSTAKVSVWHEIEHSGTNPDLKQAHRFFHQFNQVRFKYQ